MDSFKFRDIRLEKKPNAISNPCWLRRITTLFRLVILLIIASRFATQLFAFQFKMSAEQFRGISVTLISPRFVFVLGNAIVIALFFMSRSFSGKIERKRNDFYGDYVEKCRNNQNLCIKKEKKAIDSNYDGRFKMCRSYSENLERGSEHRRELRRSTMVTEKRRRTGAGLGGGRSSYEEDEMSGEEFRQTVEAFIARQQRILREQEFVTRVAPPVNCTKYL